MLKNIQRYNLANHIQWLQSGSPGGHKVGSMHCFRTK